MSQIDQPFPKSKVELHIHLDGAIRAKTIYETAKRRGIDLGVDNYEMLQKMITVPHDEPVCLTRFLSKFSIFMPAIVGDAEAVKRIAYELCEDSAREGIIYSEVRICPHLLANSYPGGIEFPNTADGRLTPRQVVQLVCEGLKEGGRTFGTKACSVLCCMRHKPEWSKEILDMCVEFKDQGVVGIDLAGDENLTEVDPTHQEHIQVFKEAKRLGINRSVHAGENGTAANVIEAVDEMHCQRIGHGYHALDDDAVYQRMLQENMHFEMCPYSSIVTGSVSTDLHDHPLKRFVADKANFSLSTDDPLITGKSLSEEYQMVIEKLGLSLQDIMLSNINAARASFLPDAEKEELVARLKKEYGLVES